MIWSHSGFQGLPPSSTFLMSIGVGGAGLACAGEAVAIPMKNTKLTVNNDVFSAEILMFTGSPPRIDLLRCHPSRDCSASGSARKDHARNQGDLPWSNTPPCPEGTSNRRAYGSCRLLPAGTAWESRHLAGFRRRLS